MFDFTSKIFDSKIYLLCMYKCKLVINIVSLKDSFRDDVKGR